MKDKPKTKEELLAELHDARQQIIQLKALQKKLATPSHKKTNRAGTSKEINVAGIHIQWQPAQGLCTFGKLPVAMMWIDTTLARVMAGVQAMVGTDRFALALQSEGRKSVEDDWKVISQYGDFKEGFKAIANIAAVAGWGEWRLISFNKQKKECLFQIKNSWEGLYQKALGVCWGSGMLAGKMAGYCSRIFGTNCWAKQTAFIARGNKFDMFIVKPSKRSVEAEIEKLLATDKATRADMAVALANLSAEIADRINTEKSLRQSEGKFRSLVENTPIGVWQDDAMSRTVYANPSMLKMLEVEDIEQIKGKKWKHFFSKQDLKIIEHESKKRMAGIASSFEIRVMGKHGGMHEVLVYGSPIVSDDGTLQGTIATFLDITKLKQAEKEIAKRENEIKASEEKYRDLVENINDVLYSVNKKGIITYISPTVKQLLGYSSLEIIGRHFTDFVFKEDLRRIKKQFHKIIAGHIEPTEYRLVKKSSDICWIRTSSRPVYENNRVTGLRGLLSDITERKQMEATLHESEALFRSQFEFGNIGIAITSVDQKWLRTNMYLCNMLGYSQAELQKKTWAEMTYPDDLADDLTQFQKMLAGKIDAYEMDKRFFHKDGSIVHTHLTVSCFRNPDRTVRFVIASLGDITRRKEAEIAIKQSEEILQSIFRASPTGIGLVSSPERTILQANKKLCEMLGYAEKELLGKSARILYPSDHEFERVGKEKYKMIQQKGTGTVETRWKRKDGSIIDVLLSSSPIDPNDFSLGVTFTALDISERRKSDIELKKRITELEKFYDMAVGRELRMVELKKQIQQLTQELKKQGK